MSLTQPFFSLLGLHYGTGRHMTDLQPHNIEKAMMVR
jgi:hypothetical protein